MRTPPVPMDARHIAPAFGPSPDVATCPNCGRLTRMVSPHLGHLVCGRCYDRVGRPNQARRSVRR